MKRWLFLPLLLALLAALPAPCSAGSVGTSAGAAILMDADTGDVLYEHRADERRLIASTTKIMTALVALDCARLGDRVEVTADHMAEGSSMYLKAGETVTVEELLYGLLLCSGNDAALCLADHCGGLDFFVEKMNEKARALGMVNTFFENPSGLDGENHCSTARDMAILAAYAVKDPAFLRFCATTSVTIGDRIMTNHNKLLKTLPGCVGLKTGYTKAAGRTLVSCCVRDGRRLVAVTLCDGNDWADHAALYTWGFGEGGTT